MKKGIIVALAFIMTIAAHAQEFKLAKSTGRLEIKEVNRVTIEGYSGTEIVFTSKSNDREKDERAKGLRAVSSLGLEDNTGLGLSVVDKGGVIEVQQPKDQDP